MMPCRDSASVQVLASAIWPTAAAAWLSSRLSEPGGELEHGAAERNGAGGDNQDVAFVAMDIGQIRRQRGQPGFVEPAGPRVDEERGADLHDDAAEVGKRRRFHGRAGLKAGQLSLQLGFMLKLRLVLKAIIARQAADQLAPLPLVEDAAHVLARDAGHGGNVALPDFLANDDAA